MAFLEAKRAMAPRTGFEISLDEISPIAKPHQKDIIRWACRLGRAAIFASFGLGKTLMQLEAVRLLRQRAGGFGLIIMPLGVRQEFIRDAKMLGTAVKFIRELEERDEGEETIYLTNYEPVRDGKLDPREFTVLSLDEAAVLRGFGGSKTFREYMRLIAGDDRQAGVKTEGVPYRIAATAVPDPNSYEELLAYAAFLDVMDIGQAKTRFFKRDATKADNLTLYPHKEDEFWQWVSSWALFIQRPSDLGHDDTGYALPPIEIEWHEVQTDHAGAGAERDGQARLFRNAALSLPEAAREKRDSIPARIDKLMELRAQRPEEHVIVWHDLETERAAIQEAIPEASSVWGTMDLEERERRIVAFSDGEGSPVLSTKPSIAGSGCNFQRYCAWSVFLGIGFKFNELIQAVHRVHRFLQTRPVKIDLIYTEAEREIRRVVLRKWAQYDATVARMTALIRKHGLAHAGERLERQIAVDRVQVDHKLYRLVCGDSVDELRLIDSDSVGFVATSIPFSTQYEYSPSYRDLGHTDDDSHFFAHLGYTTRELFRVLKPGRVLAVHVKDRITPGGVNGFGFQTVNPLSDKTVPHYTDAGFAFLGRKVIVTDVVRENNQTYRLGWTEQCKDGSRMGVGMPEYVMLFRKPPTDRSNGYADEPVTKSKEEYSLARWQVDAHAFTRSNGNRLLAPEELADLPHEQIFKRFRKWCMENVYDFDLHVRIGEALAKKQRLPTTFMVLQPSSWHPDVWTDVARMRTLNTAQAVRGKEQHLCPMPIDIARRLIVQFSEEGDVVLDPFGGLMTVPYCAVALGRIGWGIELSRIYFTDGVFHVEQAARERESPAQLKMFTELEEPSSPSLEDAVAATELS